MYDHPSHCFSVRSIAKLLRQLVLAVSSWETAVLHGALRGVKNRLLLELTSQLED